MPSRKKLPGNSATKMFEPLVTKAFFRKFVVVFSKNKKRRKLKLRENAFVILLLDIFRNLTLIFLAMQLNSDK